MRYARPTALARPVEGDPHVHRVLRHAVYDRQRLTPGAYVWVPDAWVARLERDGVIGTGGAPAAGPAPAPVVPPEAELRADPPVVESPDGANGKATTRPKRKTKESSSE